MADLRLYLLGPPRVELDEIAIAVKPRKALALLIYLAVTGQRHTRDALATLLWPEAGQRRARKSLRSRLSELNLALGDQWVEADRDSVGLRAGFWLDVAQFQQDLAENATDLQTLRAAVDCYQDDFLTGFTLPDCPAFDEWQFFQSESLRHALASALEQLATRLADQADYEAAIQCTRRWLSLDPQHEAAHRQLMRLYAQDGQQAAALRQYDRCHQTLQEELGVSPSPETTNLYEKIQGGTVADRRAPSRLRHNLPIQTTLFIGRERELADIARLLLDEPGCRMLNLVGPGGIGKTRLALAAAGQLRAAFADGVYFVSLAPAGEAADIVSAMAAALRFTFYGSTDPKEQLLDFLSQRELLLVMDNFEHLRAESALLAEILHRTSAVTLLATSRERLQLQEEWVLDVQGLDFPAGNAEVNQVADGYPAVQLFLQRARQVDVTFAPTADEMVDILRICQVVEGMPLGLELAAPWIKVLSCQEIATEIERSLDILASPLQNMPKRHRSLRVVFAQTWARLLPTEQSVLMCLSVFRGGCTRTAAAQVAGATLPLLSSLVDKALLRRTNTGRYELHELIRQFAAMQLQADPQRAGLARQRHRTFFIDFLAARTAGVKGRGQLETLTEIEADIDNVRLAWRGAVANQDVEAIEQSAACLFVYYLYRNGYDEGQSALRRAVAALAAVPDARLDEGRLQQLVVPEQRQNLVGFLLAGLGYFLAHRRDLQQGQGLLEQALALLRQSVSGDRGGEGFALLWLGWAHHFQGQHSTGQRYARESLQLFRATGDAWGEGWALLLWANCLRDGRPAAAASVYQRGLAVCQESGDQFVGSYLSLNMGNVANELGRYGQAQQQIDLAVTFSEQIENTLGVSYALLSRGRLQIARGRYRQATTTLQEALRYFTEVGTVHASRAQLYLGLAHYLQGDYDRAGQLYARAVEGLQAANSKLELSRCLNGLGRLAYDQGELQQAEQFQQESLALLQEPEREPALAAATLRYLGQVLLALDEQRHAQARDCFRQALALANEHQLAPIALDLCLEVALLLAEQGEVESTVELLLLAEQHEASTYHTWQRARRLLAHWREQLSSTTTQRATQRVTQRTTQRVSPRMVQASQEEQPALELWATVQKVLANV